MVFLRKITCAIAAGERRLPFFLTPDVYLKIGAGFALTHKAEDFTPELGIMMRFNSRR